MTKEAIVFNGQVIGDAEKMFEIEEACKREAEARNWNKRKKERRMAGLSQLEGFYKGKYHNRKFLNRK